MLKPLKLKFKVVFLIQKIIKFIKFAGGYNHIIKNQIVQK